MQHPGDPNAVTVASAWTMYQNALAAATANGKATLDDPIAIAAAQNGKAQSDLAAQQELVVSVHGPSTSGFRA